MLDTALSNAPVEQPAAVSDSDPKTSSDKSTDTVAYNSYAKAVDELKKAKSRLRDFEAAEKSRTEQKLQEQGDYQTLLNQRDEELKAIRDEMAFVKKQEADRRKLASVLNAAGGEIDPKWYQLIEYDQVIINPETGEVDQMSVAKVVENTKKSFPEIIRNPNGPRLPVEAPRGGGAYISRAEWLKLPSKEMKKYKQDQITD